ncbi:AbiU2 domain-containing protein [Vibrio parahaemolyticus]|uniref:AbiU2 domain-containing protein n=1 Tax=Vibrio parahaemolyticus TaxID=670 RepID=UPI00226A6FC1|nr:hypothetical protein [Vibrio parahaemolyticus]MCX8789130.1 hypothetical protein [Vibrio parahaemolyticus]MCX8850231.1 hypothetical protein [Vibrio parahaemolyticus]
MEHRVKKVRAYSTAMISRLIIADRKLALLNPLLNDSDLIHKWDHSYGGHGLELMRITMYLDIVRELAAISFDRGNTSPSIFNILELISSKPLLEALKRNYCKPTTITWVNDVDPESRAFWEERHKERDLGDKSQRFDEHYHKAKKLFSELKGKALHHKIRNVRNKLVAHYEMRQDGTEPRLADPKDFNLKWGDVESYFEELKPIIVELVLLISNEAYALDLFREDHERISRDFWKL